MKTKEELNALKEEVETLNKKLHELTDEELAQVTGGSDAHRDAVKNGIETLASSEVENYKGYSRRAPL